MSPTEVGADKLAVLAALVEASSDAIVCADLEGRILSWNKGAEEIFGYTAEEAIGQPGEFVFVPGNEQEIADDEARRKLLAGERLTPYIAKRRRKDGKVIDLEITVSPIVDQGRVVGVVGIGRDVTERLRQEAELRRSNEELEQFAYAASHDLAEPLRVIAGFVELLAQRYGPQLDEEAHRFIRFTIDGVERMQAVIDDLLAYSRAGRAELVLQPVATGTLVAQVLQALGQGPGEASVVEVGELPIVHAEPTLLREVFHNLIGNALKFAAQSRPQVAVTARRAPVGWVFSVADNGPGVPPEHRERIFAVFSRLHGREVPGTGIGLALAKRIVERHGGKIWCEESEWGGAQFSFTLPDPVEGSDGR